MKILLLISEAWNDELYPNNTMSNWLDGMPNIEVATIYGNPNLPYNNVSKKNFRLSELAMVRSLISNRKAGELLFQSSSKTSSQFVDKSKKGAYRFYRNHSGETTRLLRDLIWTMGRIDEPKLKKFIDDFSPDIIFTQRKASIKMCRIERLVLKYSNAPMVAFTGDDEYSLNQVSYSPIFWLRRFWLRSKLKKNIPNYKLFFAHSPVQLNEFSRDFGVRTKTLVKCGVFEEGRVHRVVNNPIVITYAGKLYCNRWKTLSLLSECIKQINGNEQKIVLKIYTRDKLSKEQTMALDDKCNTFIMGAASPDELEAIYNKSDILLHVESFDKRNHMAVRYSFSTKIIDCMASGCAVMAIGRKDQTGCKYLKDTGAAFVADDKEGILSILTEISDNHSVVTEYAQRIYEVGKKYHQRECVQQQLYSDFLEVINDNR